MEPLSAQVARLEAERDDIAEMLGNILATILLPSNSPYMPPVLVMMAESRWERFKKITGQQPVVTDQPPDCKPEPFDGTTGRTTPVLTIKEQGHGG